jgi:hypothetical protein
MTPTPDENRFVGEDGTVFIASDAVNVCEWCEGESNIAFCISGEREPCLAETRKDKRNIVWKREAK